MGRVRPCDFFCISKSSHGCRICPWTSQVMSPYILFCSIWMEWSFFQERSIIRIRDSSYPNRKPLLLPPANLPSSSLPCLPQPPSLLIPCQPLIHCHEHSSGSKHFTLGLMQRPPCFQACLLQVHRQTDRHTHTPLRKSFWA